MIKYFSPEKKMDTVYLCVWDDDKCIRNENKIDTSLRY